MAILNRDDTEFKTVDKVFMNRGNSTRIQKVWVHDGTTYVLVKGRVLEAVWEKDLSTYGGMSWDGSYNRTPYNNIFKSMIVLSNGDLLGVVNYVVNNNDTHQYSSDRYALLQLSSTTLISASERYFFMKSILSSVRYLAHLLNSTDQPSTHSEKIGLSSSFV